ncbi:MAG: polysaccharide deacetylase family protein, partial [Chloroflexota bacterium]
FDDGYIDNYEIAYPIMQEFGYTGTFFIPTEFIDFGYNGYMTWDMIKEMAADGNRFESHTKNHPDLSLLKRNDHVWQILGSQETLAYHLGYKPRFLSYPSGRYSDLTLEMVESLSLWGALTTQGGTWRGFHDRYEWKRTRVSYGTTIGDFEKVFGTD